MADSDLNVATYNCRFVVDRWEERKPLLLAEVARLDCDLHGLQEIIHGAERGQTAMLRHVCGSSAVHPVTTLPSYICGIPMLRWALESYVFGLVLDLYAWFNEVWLERLLGRHLMFLFFSPLGKLVYFVLGTGWVFGNAILSRGRRVRAIGDHDTLLLGDFRMAQRVRYRVDRPGGARTLWFVNTHLSAGLGAAAAETRTKQAGILLAWLADIPADEPVVLVGDFNAPPHEPAYRNVVAAGYTSASVAVHGAEAETKDVDESGCLDYVFLRGPIRATDASLFGTECADGDPTLYPSDHYGVRAALKFTEPSE